MKKLMFVAAVAAGLVAFGDGIESANTVGYNTVSVAANTWYMAGVQFTDTATGTGISLQDFVKGDFEGKVFWDDEMAIAPMVQIYGASGYTAYYYFVDAADGSDEVTAWANGDGDAVDVTLTPGQALWFKNPTAARSVTFAGQVLAAGTKDITCTAGAWNMIANPYPTELALNGDKVTWNVAPKVFWDDEMSIAPMVQIYGASGYTAYYYFSDAADGSDEVTAWANGDGDAVDVSIPVGGALWFKASDASTVSFAK